MAIRIASLKTLSCKCTRCGVKWIPRVENPRECPNCKSYDWQSARRNGKKNATKMYEQTAK